MARATTVTKKVPVTTYEEKVTGVTLELTLEEAQFINSLLFNKLCGVSYYKKFDGIRGTIKTALGEKASLQGYTFENASNNIILKPCKNN